MIELVELMDEMIKRISLTKLSVSNAPGSKGITSVFLPGIQIKNIFQLLVFKLLLRYLAQFFVHFFIE